MKSWQPDPSARLTPAADLEQEFRIYSYMRRVLEGEMPEVDPELGAMLTGMVIGTAATMLQKLHPAMTCEQARARCRQWIKDQALLLGSMAATADEERDRA